MWYDTLAYILPPYVTFGDTVPFLPKSVMFYLNGPLTVLHCKYVNVIGLDQISSKLQWNFKKKLNQSANAIKVIKLTNHNPQNIQ